jgi:hypothetical protein
MFADELRRHLRIGVDVFFGGRYRSSWISRARSTRLRTQAELSIFMTHPT